jgi:hypothetical protein
MMPIKSGINIPSEYTKRHHHLQFFNPQPPKIHKYQTFSQKIPLKKSKDRLSSTPYPGRKEGKKVCDDHKDFYHLISFLLLSKRPYYFFSLTYLPGT